MEGQAAPPKPTKQQQVTIAPFDSAHSVVHSLQTRDTNALIAALNQIEKRASALNALPAPRAKPDLLLDYLQQNPTCEGIFQAWDLANKTNSSPLSSSILNTLTALLRLLSTDPFTPSPPLIKTLLSAQYTPYLERALNPGRNDVTTAAFKMCNVLVGFAGGRFARRVFGAFGWSPKITTRLYKTRLRTLTSSTALTRPDLRTLLVLLVLGFLSANDVRLKTQVLETKGLLSGVFKGLNEDPESVVNLVLEVVGREIVGDRRVGLEARRNAFDEATINELVKLYDFPLPSISADEPLPSSHPTLSIHRFLQHLSHWLADQIASSPPGRSGGPQKVLGNVLKALKVTEEKEQRELGLKVLGEAPVLAGAFWSKFPSSLDPRLSSRWISAITFATRVVSLPVPLTLSLPLPQSGIPPAPPSLQSVLDTLLPPSLTRTWYTKALAHETPLVSFLSSLFLLSILQKSAATLEVIAATSARLEEGGEGKWAALGRRVRREVGERVPGAEAIVGLMTRVAGDIRTEEGKKGKGKGKKEEEQVPAWKEEPLKEEQQQAKEQETQSALLLRTNVALRLLYLYHRVCPHLIASLKYDYTKLPQTFSSSQPSSSPPSLTSNEAQGESAGDEAPGLTALSASYSLRLSALHSASSGSATAAWSRPADHYRNVLVPLFELYRTGGMTTGNREMVRRMLGRQMRSPVLFGAGTGTDVEAEGQEGGEGEEGEVEVWLRAVAESTTSSDPMASKEVLDFFQEAVKKTLTTPLKAADMAALAAAPAEEGAFSPLLKTVLTAFPSLPSPPSPAILSFLRNLFLSFLGAGGVEGGKVAKRLAGELKDGLSVKGEEGRKIGRLVKECLSVLEGKLEETEVQEAGGLREKMRAVLDTDQEAEGAGEEDVNKLVEGLGPKSGNVFVALAGEGDEELLKKTLSALPLPLALLHARTNDFSSPTTSAILLALVTSATNSSSILPSLQLLLYRFSSAPNLALSRFISTVYASPAAATNEAVKATFRRRVAAKNGGIRKAWEKDGERAETYEAVAELLASVFDAEKVEDVERVTPFTEAVLAGLSQPGGEADGKEKKKRRKSQPSGPTTALSTKVLASAPLLPFFSASSSLPLLSALLASADSPAPPALLEAVFSRVLAIPSTSTSSDLLPLWTAHFSRLNKLAAEGSEAAGRLLAKGAEGLMPFSAATMSASQRKSDDEAWRSHAAQWTEELLTPGGKIGTAQAKVLAALVYRSPTSHERFVAYLSTLVAAEDISLLPVAEPLKALLEAAAAKGETAQLPDELSARFVKQVVASSSSPTEEAYLVIRLLAASSPSFASSIRSSLEAHIASLGRDEFRAPLVKVVAELDGAMELKESVVNGALEGLTWKFAGDEEDGDETTGLVEELAELVEKVNNLNLKGHLLSPFITAVATRRPDQLYALRLATALSKVHRFKDNEVTRHLNETFASSFFLSLSSASLTESTTPVLSLILALSASSASAAANARAAERLIPFYRGTLSSLDRSILALFQRTELASGQSVSPVLKSWNPSAADSAATLLDGSRISALGASQRAFVRRSWARAFASVRTVYTAEQDEKAYDPRFLLSFVAALIEEDDLKPQEWTTLLESGALGTVVASLASSEASMRVVARATLAKLLKKIHPLTFREKDELFLVLTQVRLSVYSPAGEAIPSSIALFLAHCTSLLGQPDSPLYPAFERFLLQRSTVDLRDVPMFYLMIYSSNSDEFAAEPREERRWMVRFLTEGLVRTQDWKIYRRRQVFELLASLFQASRQDAPLRKLILQFLLRATSLPSAARELLSRNGLLGWLAAQSPLDVAERRLLLGIVRNIIDVLAFEEKKLEGVADAVEAVEAAIGNEVSVVGANELLNLVRVVVSRLPAPSTSASSTSLRPLILTRLTSLVSRFSPSLDISAASQETLQRFYLTVMALSFVRFEAGLREGKEETDLFSKALEAGLKGGIEELKKQVMRSVCQ
ncbi:hypothetical protein JCM11251_002831 [Rhodosporidiobolus azoricus]